MFQHFDWSDMSLGQAIICLAGQHNWPQFKITLSPAVPIFFFSIK